MRLLISGDRNWKNKPLIKDTITYLFPEIVIQGGAPGADKIASTEAKNLGIEVLEFKAEWDRYGKGAGPIRNQKMIDEGKPDLIVAFHDDITKSSGTADMLIKAAENNIYYCIVMNWY